MFGLLFLCTYKDNRNNALFAVKLQVYGSSIHSACRTMCFAEFANFRWVEILSKIEVHCKSERALVIHNDLQLKFNLLLLDKSDDDSARRVSDIRPAPLNNLCFPLVWNGPFSHG